MLPLVIALVIYVVSFCVVLGGAVIAGGREERLVAIGFFVTVVASQIGTLVGNNWNGPEYGVALVDGIYLVFLVIVACRSTRYWPIWAAASQLIGFLSHIPVMFDPDLPKTLYVAFQNFWAFPILISIIIGTFQHRRQMTLSLNQKATEN
jgi:hypothetical protein